MWRLCWRTKRPVKNQIEKVLCGELGNEILACASNVSGGSKRFGRERGLRDPRKAEESESLKLSAERLQKHSSATHDYRSNLAGTIRYGDADGTVTGRLCAVDLKIFL